MSQVTNTTEAHTKNGSPANCMRPCGVSSRYRVLIIGCGGLGTPAALALALNWSYIFGSENPATQAIELSLLLVDPDTIELSNLNRQILYTQKDIGKYKSSVLAERLSSIIDASHSITNISIEYDTKAITHKSISELVSGAHFIIEATDCPTTKFIINDYCIKNSIPFCHAGVSGISGQVLSVAINNSSQCPGCLRCLFGDFDTENYKQASDDTIVQGVIGPMPGIIGSLQAHFALSYLSSKSQTQSKLMRFSLSDFLFKETTVKPSNICTSKNKTNSQVAEFYTHLNKQTKQTSTYHTSNDNSSNDGNSNNGMFSRHFKLRGWSQDLQTQISNTSVVIFSYFFLTAFYLAGAGVENICLIDDGTIKNTNFDILKHIKDLLPTTQIRIISLNASRKNELWNAYDMQNILQQNILQQADFFVLPKQLVEPLDSRNESKKTAIHLCIDTQAKALSISSLSTKNTINLPFLDFLALTKQTLCCLAAGLILDVIWHKNHHTRNALDFGHPDVVYQL